MEFDDIERCFMTTEEIRQNLINSIMDLDEKNPYKKQLLEIMQCYEKGELTDLNAYGSVRMRGLNLG